MKSIEQLERLTDAMVDDILSLTDDEVLVEAKEDLDNYVEEISHTRSVIFYAVNQLGTGATKT